MPDSPVLLITGASSGIGATTARLFAAQGYRLALAARRFERLQELASEVEQSGGQALAVAADVTSLDDITNLVDSTLDRFGQIDVLFNNAGIGRMGWLETLDPLQEIDQQLKINLWGVVQTARAVLPHMMARRGGHIINMSSIAGWLGTPTYSIYAASKFGVRGFTNALRREVAIYGIHVSGIYPGGVETEFSQQAGIRRKTGLTTPSFLRLSAEQVAGEVFGLVLKPRRSLIIPWPMRWVVWFNCLFPGIADWVIEKRFVEPERQL
jgi:short-subunit dehydrogenase